ncbi:MAG: hypothetical protein ACI4CX_06955 [Candidatus Weimeria sp.]
MVQKNVRTPDVTDPSNDEIDECSKKYGFPDGSNDDVIGLAYTYVKHFLKEKKEKAARYCMEILYGLVPDKEIKKVIDSIPED